MHFEKIQGVGEGIHPLITLKLKKSTRTLDFQSNEPILKFLQLPFLYKLYICLGHNLQLLPWGQWGRGCYPQRQFPDLLTMLNNMAILKFDWIGVGKWWCVHSYSFAFSKFISDAFHENTRCVCWGGGCIHPLIILNLKVDSRTFDY